MSEAKQSDSTDLLGPLLERVAAAGCPPPGWVAPGVVPSPVGRLYTQAELDAAVAAERERLRSALEWYAAEARSCAKHSHTGNHAAQQALLASVTVLALDGGRRADEALKA